MNPIALLRSCNNFVPTVAFTSPTALSTSSIVVLVSSKKGHRK